MRADWIRADKFKPKEVGTYLVTTAKGAVILDRFDGESWSKCTPRASIKGSYGKYKMHKAWSFLPPAYNESEVEE